MQFNLSLVATLCYDNINIQIDTKEIMKVQCIRNDFERESIVLVTKIAI